ncbi:MAG: hypothetical protein EA353_00615 [Puniceicoccaceae bacterium]|nr:MAG: hypothetical protein EA353_00615 [Puniceicoccaceae bacterium]
MTAKTSGNNAKVMKCTRMKTLPSCKAIMFFQSDTPELAIDWFVKAVLKQGQPPLFRHPHEVYSITDLLGQWSAPRVPEVIRTWYIQLFFHVFLSNLASCRMRWANQATRVRCSPGFIDDYPPID